MNYYMGVDIGTTAVKVVAFSGEGTILAQQSGAYKMLHPHAGWSEHNPEDIFTAVIESINKVYSNLQPAVPLVVSFSSLMHSLLLIDKKEQPLTNSIIWADNRAADIAEALKDTALGKKIYHITGVPVHAMSPLCKLLWFKENDPALFDKAARFISIKEYVFFRLFGKYQIDTAVASSTALFNFKTLQWDDELLDLLDISRNQLSEVVSVKHKLLLQAGGPLQLPAQTPFIIGGSDGASANLSIGNMTKQPMVVTVGTSAAVRILTTQPATDNAMRTFCYHAKDKSYIIGGAANNGAIVLEWLKETWLQTDDNIAQLLEMAATVAPGCEGLLFLPYLLGERAPLWDAHAKAVFFGLTINHTKAHMVRAAMEAVIYNIYSVGRVIMENNDVSEVYATGGFTRNPLWLQMLADIFNRKVLLSASEESSALGAAMIGIDALQLKPLPNPAVTAVYKPNSDNHTIYMKHFRQFERLYVLLKHEFAEEDAFVTEKTFNKNTSIKA